MHMRKHASTQTSQCSDYIIKLCINDTLTQTISAEALHNSLYRQTRKHSWNVLVAHISGHTGGINITDCESCTAGYYCQQYGLEEPDGPCDPGYFCPGGQDTARPLNLACSPGHFCPRGSWNETGCPSGYFQPQWKLDTCDICPAGSYCKAFGM